MLSEQRENPQKGAKRRDSRNLYPPRGGKKGGLFRGSGFKVTIDVAAPL
jgi:hypothetical protein